MICAWADSRSSLRASNRAANGGLLLAESEGRWIGKRLGIQVHFFPHFRIILKTDFVLKFVEGEEQELANEGEVAGVAGRDAVLGDGLKEFAEDEVDVRGGHETAGESGGELGAEAVRFDDLALGASVEDAERRMMVLAEHATDAAVGERELAERGIVDGDAGTGLFWFIHGFPLAELSCD